MQLLIRNTLGATGGLMLGILVGLFLIAHGLVHAVYFAPATDPNFPMTASKSWLVTRAGLSLGVVGPLVATLAILALVGFCMTALSFWGLLVPHVWLKVSAVFSATVSLVLIAATWNNQFVVGVAINVAILYWAIVYV